MEKIYNTDEFWRNKQTKCLIKMCRAFEVSTFKQVKKGNIKNGTFDPFGGKYTTGELLGMNKYVKGIDASLPK